MKFVIWGTDFKHKAGEFCQRITSELYFISGFRTDYLTECDGKLVRGTAGGILIAHPGDVIYHGPTPEMKRGFVNDWIKLSGDDVSELLRRYPLPRNTPFRVSDPSLIEGVIRDIQLEYSKTLPGQSDMCELILTRLIITLYRELYSSHRHSAREKLDVARGRIMGECERAWTLAEMSALTGYSQSRFSSLYREYYGVSPVEDLISQRIERAKLLLLHGAMTVDEVTERVGFSSIYYFSRAFKERVGMPPTQWLKENRK